MATQRQRVGAQAITPRRVGAGRRPTVPERSADFAHLTLPALRAYRRTLTHEESRVSQHLHPGPAWTSSGTTTARPPQPLNHDEVKNQLRGVLAEARPGESRQALVSIVPIDDIPPLPDLEELWSREVRPGGPGSQRNAAARPRLAPRCSFSAYRTALHARLGAATRGAHRSAPRGGPAA